MGKGRFLAYHGLTAMAVAAGLAACSSEQSGACPGNEDGTYFRLQMYNADGSGSMDVNLNGRFIGSVPAAVQDPTTSNITDGEKYLGEFPSCDADHLSAVGNATASQSDACSTPAYLAAPCTAVRHPDCYIAYIVVPGSTGVTSNPPADYLQLDRCRETPVPQYPNACVLNTAGTPVDAQHCPCFAGWTACSPG